MTQFFFSLTPDRVLDAVETSGFRCTGRCLPLNSYENRVYEIELEGEEESRLRRRVIKFYRPGRWSKEQILEEHEFLLDLLEAEIPVVAPIRFENGKTLHFEEESGLWYALFPKVGGRIPDEMNNEQLEWVGRLLGRIHNVGASKVAKERISLNAKTYGTEDLAFLMQGNWVSLNVRSRYEEAAQKIIQDAEKRLFKVSTHRIHGDCHMSNLLWGANGPFFLDFDDMVCGPAVQDVWLLTPGRDDETVAKRSTLLQGYEEMRPFDDSSLQLIEPLRSLRFLHYTAWLARRWQDPAFPLAFPQFNTQQYWEDRTRDLEDQVRLTLAM